jgi:N-acetylglucosamine kinase-like BadF-type ATPase
MVFIVESGSTKADWILLDASATEVGRWSVKGLNPYFHDADEVERTLRAESQIMGYAPSVEKVFFYGAGCSSDALNAIIAEGLERVFPRANVVVDHDLLAAAYATYFGEPHIACILGTGSNSCYFDGTAVHEEVPALAYILGDEGSASYIGKRLVRDFLYKRLPADLHAAFVGAYGVGKAEIFQAVYNEPNANVYLANYARFAGDHAEHPYIQEIVFEGFKAFIEFHVLCFAEARQGAQVNFVGSVAKAFEPMLQKACAEAGVRYGRTQAKPVNRLVEYHIDVLRVLEPQAL